MSKPAAVIRQAKAADKLVRDLNARPADAAAAAAAAASAPPAGAEPVPNLPEVTIAPAGAPAAAEPPAAAAPAVDNWEHKYKVLKGKYDKEVPQLVENLRETRQLAEHAVRSNQELQTQLRQPAASAPAAPTRAEETFHLVTKEERASFGDDLIDVVGRRAQEVVAPEVQQLRQEMQQLRQQVGSVAHDSAAQRQANIYRMLNERVPEWTAFNESVEFLAWLEQVDLFSGSSRRNALAAAWNAGDAPRVTGIFEAYKQEDASTRSASTRQPTVAAETLIAPGVPRGGSTEAAPGSSRGKIWSEHEIRDFYDRVRKKRVSKDEYNEVSSEIARAVSEGRVKPDRVDIHMNQR